MSMTDADILYDAIINHDAAEDANDQNLNDLISELHDIADSNQISKWIKLEDKAPTKGERVLLFDNGGFGVLSGRAQSSGIYLEGELDRNCNVTHWMPLPNPPKSEG